MRRKFISLMNKATALALPLYGSKLPIVVVNEYPKCGGTWCAKMLASAIELPFIDGGYFVPSVPCVLRTHWHPKKTRSPTVFVIRDGRDVLISLFHHRCKNIDNVPKLKTKYIERFGESISAEKIREQIGGFIEIESREARYGVQVSWSDHTRLSREISDSTVGTSLVRYEDMVADPGQALAKIIDDCFQITIEEDRIAAVVAMHSKNLSTSTPTIANQFKTTFIRSGKTGGWSEVFDKDAAKIFNDIYGDQLLSAGYESDPNWWNKL